ncbi:Oligopeptide transporter 5 [Hibiscus syriacus]|uniref:Oligopeptide transporter 5 n=1 Tax=Hibiscus syriacus TaxID=106335 RepID=A0A6A2XWK8_HIBSY|nr:Oligopeptide transporter 5 [Hibiscus syriacus]
MDDDNPRFTIPITSVPREMEAMELSVSSISAQIVVLPLGKLMAATLPKTEVPVPLTPWSFSLNPGPFTKKEHVLITIFANRGAGGVYAVNIITIVKAFYHRSLHPVAAMLLAQTTQLLGYGWAVCSEKSWLTHLTCGGQSPWSKFLCSVHYTRRKRDQKNSIPIQQIGSGLNGFGIGSFGLDWATVAVFLGSPLATPFFAIFMRLSILACEGFGKQLQLPWCEVLLACVIALCFTLPVGIIQATTNMAVGLNVITELVIGYLYPGKPMANVSFKTYGYISMVQALMLLSDFKLGHYMKIPPKSMFVVQLVGTIVDSTCYFGTSWWLLSSIEYICNPALLPEGSPWTCPGDDVFYNASIIWGVVGTLRMFTKYGNYKEMTWFFLIGLLSPIPVWWLSRKFPEKKWIKLIHMPMILGATMSMLPAKAVHHICWGTVGLFFNRYVYSRYNRTSDVLYFTLQSYDITGPQWWGLKASDHCELARCPTFSGVVSEGCPAV